MTIRLEGLQGFERVLNRLDDKTRGRVLKRVALAAAEPIVDDAKAHVPTGPGRGGKHLRDEIQARASIGGRGSQVTVRVGFSSDTFYGKFLELGRAHQVAKPFLRPALESQQGEVLARFRDAMRRELEAVKGR